MDDLPVLSIKYSSVTEETQAVEHDGAAATTADGMLIIVGRLVGEMECGMLKWNVMVFYYST